MVGVTLALGARGACGRGGGYRGGDALIVALAVALAVAPPSPAEAVLVERARDCAAGDLDPWLALAVLRVEALADVPPGLRGLSLAAACRESRYVDDARGDCAIRESCPARGWHQQWPWWERRYGHDRTDPLAATWAYLGHVRSQVDRTVPRHCRSARWSRERVWIAAEAYAVRAPPRPGRDRCREVTGHVWDLRRWRR